MQRLEDVRFKCVVPSERVARMLFQGCRANPDSDFFTSHHENCFFEFEGKPRMEINYHSSRADFHQSKRPLLSPQDALKWLCDVLD